MAGRNSIIKKSVLRCVGDRTGILPGISLPPACVPPLSFVLARFSLDTNISTNNILVHIKQVNSRKRYGEFPNRQTSSPCGEYSY
uniref:Uncharacterized protein n=1 Tax=Kalanchoe fedtschenkoi TaxID=63787 RepID=A0A7N0T7X1_KALFE